MPRANKLDIAKLASDHAVATSEAKYEPLFAPVPASECVPTGVTILNLAMSGRVDGGAKQGTIVHTVGDSDTGKSVLAMTFLAEGSVDPRCAGYDLIKDDPECSDSFPVREMFGSALADRIKHPAGEDGDENSYYIEDFFFNIYERLQTKKPFLYVLDSMDGLESHAGVELFEENAKRAAAGNELKQSYGDGKAKKNSENLRKLKADLKASRSILNIVSQTRDNINPMSMQEQVHAGGRALKFVAQYQMWLAPRGKIVKNIHGKEHACGVLARVRLSKNHVTGRHLDFVMEIPFGYGVDDERTTVRWMCDPTGAGLWKLGKGVVTTKGECGLEKEYKASEFVSLARKSGDFRNAYLMAVQQAWDNLEKQLRKPGRYSGVIEEVGDE
jgi:RecA/RadA recombinase